MVVDEVELLNTLRKNIKIINKTLLLKAYIFIKETHNFRKQ